MTGTPDGAMIAKFCHDLPGFSAISGFADIGVAATAPDQFRADDVHAIAAVRHTVIYQPALPAVAGISHFADDATCSNMQLIDKSGGHDGVICVIDTNHRPGSRRACGNWNSYLGQNI